MPANARKSAYFGLGVGLSMALAANLTATWPQGAVMIGTGLTAPLVLPLALWIRAGFTPTHLGVRVVRELSIAAVATPAASLSYWHTYALMTSHGVPQLIAVVLPLSADGVATISTLSLHHQRRPSSQIQVNRPKSLNLPPKSTPVSTLPAAKQVTAPKSTDDLAAVRREKERLRKAAQRAAKRRESKS